jgi:hypothetical protein
MGFEYKTYLVFFIISYSCLFIFIELQDLLRILNSLFGGGLHTFQLIGDSQLFPFVCP